MVAINDAYRNDDPSWESFLAVLCQSHYEFFQHKRAEPTPEEALNSLDMACRRIPSSDVKFGDPALVRHAAGETSHIRYVTDPHPSIGLGMLILIAFGDLENNSLDELLHRYSPEGELGASWRTKYEQEVLNRFLERYNFPLQDHAA